MCLSSDPRCVDAQISRRPDFDESVEAIMSEILWRPTQERAETSQMWAFAREASRRTGLDLSDYSALHQWSVGSPESFWELVWEVCEVIGDRGERSGPAAAGVGAVSTREPSVRHVKPCQGRITNPSLRRAPQPKANPQKPHDTYARRMPRG